MNIEGKQTMGVSPKGLSIQSAYRQYREKQIFVNRKYQRKLVWTVTEKAKLIDSILRGYPIPLILLAEHRREDGLSQFEIVDGMQRLNAVFDFIENKYSSEEGKFFDTMQFARAQQAANEQLFERKTDSLLSPIECANFLDYELAVTIYPTTDEDEITDIFGRINSNGRQLSSQEKRQAGVINPFAEMIRKLSAEIRGDVSSEILLLTEMPSISIDTIREKQGYKILAEDTVWCRQGILDTKLLRESEDEQMLADIAASILLEFPLASSRELLDEIYTEASPNYKDIQARLITYGAEQLAHHIKTTFSVLIDTIESYNKDKNTLRKIVRKTVGRNPIKTEFYAIFMAFFRLLVQEERSPDDPTGIANALYGLQKKLSSGTHYITTANRKKNIGTAYGLIEQYFVKKEPPVIRHGAGLKIDFVNAVRRARTETPRYEFKQGLLNLSPHDRNLNKKLLGELVETMSAIANLGPFADGYLFLGVADKERDATQIEALDGVKSVLIEDRHIVGIDRECKILKKSVEQYVELILNEIRASKLSDPLKTQILSQIDTVTYEGHTVIRVTIPKQKKVSSIGDKVFIRDGTSTIEATGTKVLAINDLF